MRIKSTTISHFRGIVNLELTFDTQTTVLAGVNGVGKSAVLEALSVLLGQFAAVSGKRAAVQQGKLEDIQIGFPEYRLDIEVELSTSTAPRRVEWFASLSGSAPPSGAQSIQFPLATAFAGISRYETLLIYYDAKRCAEDRYPENGASNSSMTLAPWTDGLSQASSDYNQFFAWFKQQEDLENETRRDDSRYRDPSLSAVRSAIERFTGLRQPRVRRQQPLRMTVLKGEIELSVNQLSEGERNILAMVGDIARRLSLLNPESDATAMLAAPGIVLIDEIELHLHPKWQREIISNLEKTFPNCQFIVTTHSPQVLSHVHENQVWILRLDTKSGVAAIRPHVTFGMDSNRILEEVMDVPERPKEARDRIEHLFGLLGSNDSARAKLELSELENQYPDLPELTQARALLRRKEIIGR